LTAAVNALPGKISHNNLLGKRIYSSSSQTNKKDTNLGEKKET
jgi:hypothetical protein